MALGVVWWVGKVGGLAVSGSRAVHFGCLVRHDFDEFHMPSSRKLDTTTQPGHSISLTPTLFSVPRPLAMNSNLAPCLSERLQKSLITFPSPSGNSGSFYSVSVIIWLDC